MLNTSRAFTGPAARQRLVLGIRDGGRDVIETDWLEWKSEADLRASKWAPLMGLYVLGFANRMPDHAARWTDGHAYLVLGVEPGRVVGVEPMDPAELESRVEPYVGVGGPRWEPHYVDIDGVAVLVVEVGPPRWGDGAHPIRKEFGQRGDDFYVFAGEIFVRRGGKTPRAGPSEIDALNQRARRLQETLSVRVEVRAPAVVRPLDLSENDRETWLKAQRARLMASLKRPRADTVRDAMGVFAMSALNQERRTPEEFTTEVDTYIAAARDALVTQAKIGALRRRVGVVSCDLVNESEHNFANVRVEWRVDGNVSAYFDADDVEFDFTFPREPVAWGKARLIDDMLRISVPSSFGSVASHALRRPGGSVDNSGSARVVYETVDLRPRHVQRLPRVHVLVESKATNRELIAHWSATATNVSGVAEGLFRLEVADDPVPFADLVATQKNDEEDDDGDDEEDDDGE